MIVCTHLLHLFFEKPDLNCDFVGASRNCRSINKPIAWELNVGQDLLELLTDLEKRVVITRMTTWILCEQEKLDIQLGDEAVQLLSDLLLLGVKVQAISQMTGIVGEQVFHERFEWCISVAITYWAAYEVNLLKSNNRFHHELDFVISCSLFIVLSSSKIMASWTIVCFTIWISGKEGAFKLNYMSLDSCQLILSA